MTDSPTPSGPPLDPPPDSLRPADIPLWIVLTFAALVTVLQCGPEWLEAYAPGIDESWMLQAGMRMYRGEGFTDCQLDDWSDLANPEYTHHHFWPPFQGLMFAGLLKLTSDTAAALTGLKIIKALATFAGVWGWLRLGGRMLPTAVNGLFALAVAALFYASGLDAGAPHLFFWAVMPWFLTALLDGLAVPGGAGVPARRAFHPQLLLAGLLAAIGVGFRYHAVYLIPGGAVVVLLFSAGPFPRRVLRAAWVAGPPVLLLGAVFAVNALHKGPSSWASHMTDQWNFAALLRHHPFTFPFAHGFGLQEAVLKLKPSAVDWPYVVYLPWYALLAAAGSGALLALRGRWAAPQARFAVSVTVFAAGLVALLAATSVRGEVLPGWVPIESSRHYSELLPAVGLVWFVLLSSWWAADARLPARALIAAVACAVVVLEVRFVYRAAKVNSRRVATALRGGVHEDPPLVAAVRRLIAAAPTPKCRVFDAYNSCLNALRLDDIPEDRYFGAGRLAAAGTTEDVYVVVVVRRMAKDGKPGMDTFWAGEYGLPYSGFFDLAGVDEVPDGEEICEIRAGVVKPFRPGQRHLPGAEPAAAPNR